MGTTANQDFTDKFGNVGTHTCRKFFFIFLRRTHVKLFSFLTHLLKNRCRFYVTDFGSKAMNRFLSFYNVLIFKIASIF